MIDGLGPGADLETVLRSIATAYVEPLLQEQTGARVVELIWREFVERHLPAEVFLEEAVEPTQQAFAAELRRVCPALDAKTARLCVQSLLGQVTYALRMRRLLESVPQRRVSQQSLQRLIDHIARFSAGGIRASIEGAETRGPSW